MTNLERAIKDGYAHIIGEKGKQKITYVSSDNHVENYSDPEEKVRAEFWAELIYKYEYPVNRIKIEVTVPDRLPTDRADIVVFRDDECKRPYAVVECKKDGVTDAEFNQAIEQGVGNATWVKLRADYVVIIAGGTRRVLDVTDKFGALEREQNILADLPHAYGKPQEFRFYKGSKNDIKPVNRENLITKTDTFLSWVNGIQRPSGQPNINKEEYKSYKILVPSRSKQEQLSSYMDIALAKHNKMLYQADRLLSACKDSVFSFLNLYFREYKPALYSVNKLEDIRELGIYCNPHSDYLNDVFSKLRANNFFAGHLEDFVEINPKTSRSGLQDKYCKQP